MMEIKAVRFRKDGFYSLPFAFGGEEGMDQPEQVTKILLTHKHSDHSGELKSFRTHRFWSMRKNCLRQNCRV